MLEMTILTYFLACQFSSFDCRNHPLKVIYQKLSSLNFQTAFLITPTPLLNSRPSLCEMNRVDFLRITACHTLINRASLRKIKRYLLWRNPHLLDRCWVTPLIPLHKSFRDLSIKWRFILNAEVPIVFKYPFSTDPVPSEMIKFWHPQTQWIYPGKYISPQRLGTGLQYPLIRARYRGSKICRLSSSSGKLPASMEKRNIHVVQL